MRKIIEKVAVLGAGTMGSRIAAHLANAGIRSVLLDMACSGHAGAGSSAVESSSAARSVLALNGLKNARQAKPAAFFDASLSHLVTVGNFDDNLGWFADCDWIIEAVVEDLAIKRDLLGKVAQFRRPGTIVTTNTSGLSVSKIAEGFPEEFQRHWFGTHFFNPPRYMRLLEIIPTPAVDTEVMRGLAEFCDLRLGKGIVYANDTPNFIANRIGIFGVLNAMRLMQQMDLSIEEVDALTGTAVGWPKSATFRTIDMVGLDIVGHVAANQARVHDERSDLAIPDFFRQMIERNWLGDKTKGGFYRKQRGATGEERMALDWKTLEYRPLCKPGFASLEMVKGIDDLGTRVQTLIGDGRQRLDKAGQFLWTALSELWLYSANRIPEIAASVADIDRAMRLGFNWELGPFELWDAAGVERTVARTRAEGHRIPCSVERVLHGERHCWYENAPGTRAGRRYFDLASEECEYRDDEVPVGVGSVTVMKKTNGEVKRNAGASLIDLGDGVGCIEFHSKMNSIGPDIGQLILQTLGYAKGFEPSQAAAAAKSNGCGADFEAFVITNDAANFSVGANLMLLLMAVQEQEWDEIDQMVRAFQSMTQAIKFSPKPVVAAPFNLTLGGGCEIALHAPLRQTHAELYMGLVESGVGLLPAGGGCKEMLLRALAAASTVRLDGRGDSVEVFESIRRTFETIAMAKVSTSAAEARSLGFLVPCDTISMNRDRVLADSKRRALEMVRGGYKPPIPRTDLPAPGENLLATLKLGAHLMRQADYISDHEVKIANRIADVLCGGAVSPGTPVSEQYLLDLEREHFKALCGEKKTAERIAYTLKTGKAMRN
jgi:3-hydroxyacyl-CoA dehydrogenase